MRKIPHPFTVFIGFKNRTSEFSIQKNDTVDVYVEVRSGTEFAFGKISNAVCFFNYFGIRGE